MSMALSREDKLTYKIVDSVGQLAGIDPEMTVRLLRNMLDEVTSGYGIDTDGNPIDTDEEEEAD